MAESKKELKFLLMKVKEESAKVGLTLKILQARLQQYINHELPDAFLPKSKNLLISWLQSPSAVILEPKEIKSVTVSIVSHLFTMK